jgi:hypothetical protein
MTKLYHRALTCTLLTSLFTLTAHAEVGVGDMFDSKLYVSGYVGNDLLGKADLIIPFLQQPDHTFFVYAQSRVSDNDENSDLFKVTPWTASSGLGFRQIVNGGSTMLGGFVLADLSQNESNKSLWDISPGIEALGTVWDFRANGYFPINKQTWEQDGFADQFHDYRYVRFTDHAQYDEWVKYRFSQEVAPGGDAEVGRKLFKINNVLVKGYIGGYYFDSKDAGGATGGSARLTVQPSEFVEFSANDTYDHATKNTFMLGMRLRLNDIFSGHPQHDVIEDHDVSARLLDPIERNLNSIGSASSLIAPTNHRNHGNLNNSLNTSTTNSLSSNSHTELLGERLELDNIAFVNGNKTTNGSGTHDDPYSYSQIEQNKAADLQNYANIFINAGTYQTGKNLLTHQSIYGRTQNYAAPATGNDRPVVIGQLNLIDGKTADSIILHNDSGKYATGVNITGSNVVLSNDEIGAQSNDLGYKTGVDIVANAHNAVVYNSTIYAYNVGLANTMDEIQATGIHMANGSSLVVDNSTISATATTSAYDDNIVYNGNGVAYGIQADGQYNNITVQNSSNISATGTDIKGCILYGNDNANGYGILVGKNYMGNDNSSIHDNSISIKSKSTIAGSGITQSTNVGWSGNGYGLAIGSGLNQSTNNYLIYANTIDVNASIITGTGAAPNSTIGIRSGNGYGILVGSGDNEDATINISNNTITIENSSSVTGTGNSRYDDDNSGNGYGLLIGFGVAERSHDSIISANNIDINDSTLTGKGIDSYYISHLDYSITHNNGYGLLIGSESAMGDGSNSGFNTEISGNILKIENLSKLIGTGMVPGADGGNGVGLLTGSGYARYDSTKVSDNAITIHNSSLTGNATKNDTYCGNAYGLLIGGYGEIVQTYVVSDNIIDINASTLTGAVSGAGSGDSNGYGLLIGTAYAAHSDTSPNIEISGNTLTIEGASTLTGIGNANMTYDNKANGNGYGLLVGVGFNQGVHVDVSQNTITLGNSAGMNNIYASSEGNVGNAYGVAFGLNSSTASNNTLSVANTKFSLNANKREAYGLWLDHSVKLIDSSIKDLLAAISRTDKGSKGAKILGSLNNYDYKW